MQTPVLFIVFNRPDKTAQVFERIRKAKPKQLFVAADGYRLERPEEKILCDEVRSLIIDNVDWDCEVRTLFREENLGCGRAVSGAITWFFEHVEAGIILEDDCVPDPSFFNFAGELLTHFKDNRKIWVISGFNMQSGRWRGDGSYYLSINNHVWGWASWRDRWSEYQFRIGEVDSSVINRYVGEKRHRKLFKKFFEDSSKIDTWDFQWMYCMWKNNGLAVIPNHNLIDNIGFGKDATHTTNSDNSFFEKPRALTSIRHPRRLVQHKKADAFMLEKLNPTPSLVQRIKRKLGKVLNL